LGANLKIAIWGQFVNFKILRGQFEFFGKFEDHNANYYQIIHHFKNSSNYYLNNGVHLKLFEFPQNITLSKHTLKKFEN